MERIFYDDQIRFSSIKRQLALALVCGSMLLAGPPAHSQVVDAGQADIIMKLCALGRTVGGDGGVSAQLTKLLRSGEINAAGFYKDVGAILEKIEPSEVGVNLYENYLACVGQQTEVLRNSGKADYEKMIKDSIARMEEISENSSSINLDLGLMNTAHIAITLSRKHVTLVRIINSNCNLIYWLDAIHYDGDGPFAIGLTIPDEAGKIEAYPHTIRLKRDHDLVELAYLRTRAYSDAEQKAIARHYTADHDTIEATMVFRAIQQRGCQARYFVKNVVGS